MFYLLEIVNRTGAAVTPASALIFDMPTGAEGTTVLEGSTKNASAKGTRVTVTGPFAPGVTPLQIAFRLDSLGSAAYDHIHLSRSRWTSCRWPCRRSAA